MDQFQRQTCQTPPAQALASRLNGIRQATQGNVSGFIEYMRNTNPDFAAFFQSIQGKTPEQAFAEYGLDYSQFRGIL